jgi:hypothetical protein
MEKLGIHILPVQFWPEQPLENTNKPSIDGLFYLFLINLS